MSGTMKYILCVTMAAAIALTGFLGAGLAGDQRRVNELSRELQESRARWEATAEKKEALQAELKKVTEDLKEARLTLEESVTRAEELRQDIAELEREIAELSPSSTEYPTDPT